jgi:glutamate-1-semialdehyde 2,1-aminomutase
MDPSRSERDRPPGFYEELNAKADYFYGKINELFTRTGLPGVVQGLGARFGLYFGLDKPTCDYREAAAKYDRKAGKRFFELVLDKGLYFHNYGEGLPRCTPASRPRTAINPRRDAETGWRMSSPDGRERR